jgi:hypothetical protein
MKRTSLPGLLKYILNLIGCIFTAGLCLPQNVPSAEEVINKMILETRKIETLKFELGRFERVDGKLISEFSSVKLQRKPFKVYLKITKSYKKFREGVEVLYIDGERNDQALVNPPILFWNLNKDPYGNALREEQHHTLFEMGYDHLMNILEYQMGKFSGELKGMLSNKGIELWRDRICWRIEFDNPYFIYKTYTLTKGEGLMLIARKYKLSEYMILEKNSCDSYDDISAGDTIEIPTDYAKRLVLLIDRDQAVPLCVEVYDEKGLFEKYEYAELIINPVFQPEEFTSSFKDYGF